MSLKSDLHVFNRKYQKLESFKVITMVTLYSKIDSEKAGYGIRGGAIFLSVDFVNDRPTRI